MYIVKNEKHCQKRSMSYCYHQKENYKPAVEMVEVQNLKVLYMVAMVVDVVAVTDVEVEIEVSWMTAVVVETSCDMDDLSV